LIEKDATGMQSVRLVESCGAQNTTITMISTEAVLEVRAIKTKFDMALEDVRVVCFIMWFWVPGQKAHKIMDKDNYQKDPDYKTIEGAWIIANKFSQTEIKRKSELYSFDDILPYKKEIIALALLNLLTSDDFRSLMKGKGGGEKILQAITDHMLSLTISYIPNENEYKRILELENLLETAEEFTKEVDIEKLDENGIRDLLREIKKST